VELAAGRTAIVLTVAGISDSVPFTYERRSSAAFKLLEEAELFCQRRFPLPGRVEPGRLQRVDRPLIPPDVMREVVVNALIHRDHTIAGRVARYLRRPRRGVEGRTIPDPHHGGVVDPFTPVGATNPIIAEVFRRAGLVEKWGRGTNRVSSR
jgi:ATP-dependent DNA helicase RecG